MASELLDLENRSFIDKLREMSRSEEHFDEIYVQAVQKQESLEAQKTIRQYQICVMIIKVATKIAFVLNVQNILSYLSSLGIHLL